MVAIRIPGPEAVAAPAIQDRERTIVPHATAASYGATTAQAGIAQARALGDMGETIVKMASLFNERRQDFQDNTYQSTFSTEYEPRARKEYLEAQKQFPDGGEGFTKDLDDRLQRAQKETHDSLTARGITASQRSQASTKTHADRTRTHYLVSGLSWENNQKIKSLETQLDTNANLAATQTLQHGDLDTGLAQVDQAIAAQHGVIPADMLRTKHRQYRQQVLDAAIEHAKGNGDYTRAAALGAQTYGEVPREGKPAAAAAPEYVTNLWRIESGDAYRTGRQAQATGSNRGLSQFGPQEERRYGITDANRDDPAVQKAAVLQERAENEGPLTAALGHKPSDAEHYMAHQQGRAGAIALYSNPNVPAWEAIRKFYKSDAIAKLAITGNIPNGNPLKALPVEQITSAQFTTMWEARWNRLPTDPDIGKAIQWSNRIQSAATNERARLKDTLESDIASIRSTGKGVPNLTHDQVTRTMGRTVADEWLIERQFSQQYHDRTQDFHSLTNGDLATRIETPWSQGGLRPDEGAIDFKRQEKVYLDAHKKAEAIRKQRVEDPAESVRPDPEVRQTIAATKWTDDPSTIQPLFTARLAAQERAGIDPGARSPITRAEGIALMAPLMRSIGFGNEREVLESTARQFQALFGDTMDDGRSRAVQALYFAMRASKANEQITQDAAAVVRKLGIGRPVTREDARKADESEDVAAADRATGKFSDLSTIEYLGQRALAGTKITQDPAYTEQVAAGLNAPLPTSMASPSSVDVAPKAAINALRMNPARAREFDAKYGKGASDQIFHNYPLPHMPPTPKPVQPEQPFTGLPEGFDIAGPPLEPGSIGRLLGIRPRPQAPVEPATEEERAAAERPAERGVRVGGRTYRVNRGEGGRISSLNVEE